MLTKQQLYDLKEDPLTNDVLIPLLTAMGYRDVRKQHGGPGELGKDIVCWVPDELECRVNIACIVKAVPITGALSIAGEVANQIMQSFGAQFLDKTTGEEQFVAKCYVITNKEITKDAQPAIQSILSNLTRSVLGNIRYIDGGELWDWYRKHLSLWAKLLEVEHELDTVDTHYRLEARVTSTGTQITAVEKYPGASVDKPFTIKFTTSIPTDTEEGRDLVEEINQFLASGVPVKVPLSYVKNLQLPEFITQALPEPTKDGFLTLGPAWHPKPLLIRFEFTNEDGEQCALEYIHLKVTQVGTQATTFTNDEQPIPIKVKLTIHLDIRSLTASFSFQSSPNRNAHQLLQQVELMNCLSKPYTMRCIDLETGLPFIGGGQRTELEAPPDQYFLEMIRALHALQIKTGKVVTIPDRGLTTEEAQMIERLRLIFLTGRLEETLTGVTRTASITPENREELQQLLDSAEKTLTVPIHTEETVTLFGEEYPLGPTKTIYLEVKLTNEQEARDKLAEQPDSELTLCFIPTGDTGEATIVKEYLNWLPGTGLTG